MGRARDRLTLRGLRRSPTIGRGTRPFSAVAAGTHAGEPSVPLLVHWHILVSIRQRAAGAHSEGAGRTGGRSSRSISSHSWHAFWVFSGWSPCTPAFWLCGWLKGSFGKRALGVVWWRGAADCCAAGWRSGAVRVVEEFVAHVLQVGLRFVVVVTFQTLGGAWDASPPLESSGPAVRFLTEPHRRTLVAWLLC